MNVEGAKRRGRVIVVSGPSGVGKSTICHRLCTELPGEFSVSVTTRPARPGEQHERDYRYVSREEFESMKSAGALLEWAEVYGHSYGTPLKPVLDAMDEGRNIILEIDIHGCMKVRAEIPESHTFFILPPTLEEQARRIKCRNTDDQEVIERRLARADGEIRFANESGSYDHFLINDNIDETVSQIRKLITRDE